MSIKFDQEPCKAEYGPQTIAKKVGQWDGFLNNKQKWEFIPNLKVPALDFLPF